MLKNYKNFMENALNGIWTAKLPTINNTLSAIYDASNLYKNAESLNLYLNLNREASLYLSSPSESSGIGIVLGTNSKAVADTDTTIAFVKTSYPKASVTDITIGSSEQYDAETRIFTKKLDIIFICTQPFSFCELGLSYKNFLFDRAVFPTISCNAGQGIHLVHTRKMQLEFGEN